MVSRYWRLASVVGVVLVIGLVGVAVTAQESPPAEQAPFKFPNTWVGSDPIDAQALKGKAALLYFFEETCPKCRGRWPAIQATAAKRRDDPIVFIAVNSGTSKPAVSQYASGVRLSWPVIVDADRSFERSCQVDEISLENIVQVRYLSADGTLHMGDWSNIDKTVERALVGAAWAIDPAGIPGDLKITWRQVEFSQYAKAAPTLAKALASRDKDLKAAAQKLSKVVNERGAAELQSARSEAQTSKYRANQHYAAIAAQFAGYPAAREAADARKDLLKDPALRKELAALKTLEKQRPLAASTKPAVRERAIAAIRKLVEEQPENEAGRQARQLLDGKEPAAAE